MKISRNSWHYKFVRSFSGYRDVPEDFCRYMRRMIFGLGVCAVGAAAVCACIFGFFWSMWFAWTNPYEFLSKGIVVYPGMILTILSLILIGSIYERKQEEKSERLSEEYNKFWDARRAAYGAWIDSKTPVELAAMNNAYEVFLRECPEWEDFSKRNSKQPGILITYYRALKNKTCPVVAFE